MKNYEVKISIRYKESLAHYTIKQETNNIFSATLHDYEGSVHDIPETHVIITKGVRHWIGSTDNDVLIHLLGEIIDIHIQSGIFQDTQPDAIKQDDLTD